MRDADRVLLDGLALMTDLREDEWALVVREVEGAGGVREVGGQARIEIERAVQKARTLTSKARPSDPKAGENQAKRPAPVRSPASGARSWSASSPPCSAVIRSASFTRASKAAFCALPSS